MSGLLHSFDINDIKQIAGEMEELGNTLRFPPPSQQTVQSVLQAMDAAEAAQQELMTLSRLGQEAAKGNKVVSDILQSYSVMQQSYHKAFRVLLDRYQHAEQLAVNPTGKEHCLWCCGKHTSASLAADLRRPLLVMAASLAQSRILFMASSIGCDCAACFNCCLLRVNYCFSL